MHGTTSIMPTTWTNTLENTLSALKGFNEIKNDNKNILGIHLEGPFINPNKLGAQPNLTEKPSLEFIKKILEISDVKIITLAPEIDGMQEFINDLVELNIKIQFGHTLADFDCWYLDMMKNAAAAKIRGSHPAISFGINACG